MSEQTYLDFLTGVGESFCEELWREPGFADASPHDFQEVLWKAVADPLSPEALSRATSSEGIAAIAAECQRWFEVADVPKDRIARAIEKSMFRWPLGSLDD